MRVSAVILSLRKAPVDADGSAIHFFMFSAMTMLVPGLLIVLPSTQEFGLWLVAENHPIEILTFVVAIWAAVEGVRLVRYLGAKSGFLIRGFLSLFTFLMFFLAMEEISWGQKFLDFPTPEFWKARNAQGELTLHNYDFAGHKYLEIYPFLFGIGGLVGIALRASYLLPWIVCPPVRLWPVFGIVVVHSGIDLYHDFHVVSLAFDALINLLDEAAEMLVACGGLFFLLLNRRSLMKLSGDAR